MKCLRNFLPLRSFHCVVCNSPPKPEECFKVFPLTLRKILYFHKIPFGSKSAYARVSLQYFRLIQVKPFACWLIFIINWIWQNCLGVFLHIFNFPASREEQLVLCEKILKEHSSNLSFFILTYCTAPGSNPPVVVWCYLSLPVASPAAACLWQRRQMVIVFWSHAKVFCVSTWSVLLCFI